MANAETICSNLFNELIGKVLDSVANYLLTTKNVSVSSEELRRALGVISQPNVPISSSLPIPTYQSFAPPVKPAAIPGVTAPAQTGVPGETCQYCYTRGQNKGKLCGKKTTPGSQYCSGCVTKGQAKKNVEGGQAQPAITLPGLAGFARPGTQMTTYQQPNVNVLSMGDGRYRDQSTGLILTSGKTPLEKIAVGYFDPTTGSQLPLTEEKKQLARQHGYIIIETTTGIPSISTGGSLPPLGNNVSQLQTSTQFNSGMLPLPSTGNGLNPSGLQLPNLGIKPSSAPPLPLNLPAPRNDIPSNYSIDPSDPVEEEDDDLDDTGDQ
jgi:hypothetical protein